MNDKERLNEIITRYKNVKPFEIYGDTGIISMVQMDEKDKDWLIEQAEKIEHLNLKYNALLDAIVGFVQQLQQAQTKIERCKEIFKDIREASSDIYALRKAEQALQALEGAE
ncbi:hypothetical protein [Geobacillus sp. CCR]